MTRIILAALSGAVVLFVWGMVSWTVLDWHTATFSTMPDEPAVVTSLASQLPQSGVYFFPAMPEQGTPEAMDDWAARHRRGPYGLLFYHAQGADPMTPATFATGFALNLVVALIVAWVLSLTRASHTTLISRMGIALLLGLLIAVPADLMPWNWMHFHAHYSLTNAADHVIGILLMSLPISLLIKTNPHAG